MTDQALDFYIPFVNWNCHNRRPSNNGDFHEHATVTVLPELWLLCLLRRMMAWTPRVR